MQTNKQTMGWKMEQVMETHTEDMVIWIEMQNNDAKSLLYIYIVYV